MRSQTSCLFSLAVFLGSSIAFTTADVLTSRRSCRTPNSDGSPLLEAPQNNYGLPQLMYINECVEGFEVHAACKYDTCVLQPYQFMKLSDNYLICEGEKNPGYYSRTGLAKNKAFAKVSPGFPMNDKKFTEVVCQQPEAGSKSWLSFLKQ